MAMDLTVGFCCDYIQSAIALKSNPALGTMRTGESSPEPRLRNALLPHSSNAP